jgi:hypothetical protein
MLVIIVGESHVAMWQERETAANRGCETRKGVGVKRLGHPGQIVIKPIGQPGPIDDRAPNDSAEGPPAVAEMLESGRAEGRTQSAGRAEPTLELDRHVELTFSLEMRITGT